MTTINPADCKPNEAYEVKIGGGSCIYAVRRDYSDGVTWIALDGMPIPHGAEVTVLHRLVPEPRAEQMEKLLDGATVVSNVPSTRLRFAAQVVLDLTGDDAARVSALDLQREAADAHLAEAEKCAEDALVEKTAQAMHAKTSRTLWEDAHDERDQFRILARAALAVFRDEADQ